MLTKEEKKGVRAKEYSTFRAKTVQYSTCD